MAERKWGNLLIVLFLLVSLGKAATEPNFTRTEVIIVGTIHDKHYKNSKYPPEVLRDIVLQLKPNTILNELPLSQVDPNGRPLFRDYARHPEGWASDTVAQTLKIKQIPFDRPDRQENFKKTKYFERQKENNKKGNRLFEKLSSEDPNNIDLKIFSLLVYVQMIESDIFSDAPNIINSQIHDNTIRLKKALSGRKKTTNAKQVMCPI